MFSVPLWLGYLLQVVPSSSLLLLFVLLYVMQDRCSLSRYVLAADGVAAYRSVALWPPSEVAA